MEQILAIVALQALFYTIAAAAVAVFILWGLTALLDKRWGKAIIWVLLFGVLYLSVYLTLIEEEVRDEKATSVDIIVDGGGMCNTWANDEYVGVRRYTSVSRNGLV